MATPHLPVFARARFSNPYIQRNRRLQHPLPLPYHPSDSQTMANMPSTGAAYFNSASRGRSLHHPGYPASIANENGYATTSRANVEPSLFDQFLQYPEDFNNMTEIGNLSQWREGYMPSPLNIPFRPMEPRYNGLDDNGNEVFNGSSSFGNIFKSNFNGSDMLGGDVGIPQMMDNSPRSLPPAALVLKMDPYQQEDSKDQAWALSSVDHEALSPSTIDTYSSGPRTPTNLDAEKISAGPTYGDGYLRHSDITEPMFKVEAAATHDSMQPLFQLQSRQFGSQSCQCITCSGTLGSLASFATIRNQTQEDFSQNELKQYGVPHGTPAHQYPLEINRHSQSGDHASALQSYTFPTPARSGDLDPLSTENHQEESDTDSSDGFEQYLNDQAVTDATHRRSRDRFLLKMRKKGLSYKEIKRRGRFREAESTLRGRVRVLTKDKDERVRKPQWTPNDLHILSRAVDRFADEQLTDKYGRVPWKKVSQWMTLRGSSYCFAPATCARKWKELKAAT